MREKRGAGAGCTMPSTSELESLVLVWPSNCGSASFTDTIAARPSRQSSPVSVTFSLRAALPVSA